MEKVRLPKEAADAIGLLKAQGMPLHEIGVKKATSNLPQVKGWSDLMKVPNDELFAALYYGYEVEQTPEDKVRELHRQYLPAHNGYGAQAIRAVLDCLGIKIEGVNA